MFLDYLVQKEQSPKFFLEVSFRPMLQLSNAKKFSRRF